jgi:hypothetical protein
MPLAVGTIACATFGELKPAVRAQKVRARNSSSTELLQVDAPTTCFASSNTEEASSTMGPTVLYLPEIQYNQIIRIKVSETFF